MRLNYFFLYERFVSWKDKINLGALSLLNFLFAKQASRAHITGFLHASPLCFNHRAAKTGFFQLCYSFNGRSTRRAYSVFELPGCFPVSSTILQNQGRTEPQIYTPVSEACLCHSCVCHRFDKHVDVSRGRTADTDNGIHQIFADDF